MVDHQFGAVIQIFVEEDTRGKSSESGIHVYRLTGGFFNLSRLRSKNLTYTTTVTEL